MHRTTFELLVSLHRRGDHIDEVLIANRLKTHELFQKDAAHYVASTGKAVKYVANVEEHAKAVSKASKARQVHDTASKSLKNIGLGENPEAVLLGLHRDIASIDGAMRSRNRFCTLTGQELDGSQYNTSWIVNNVLVEGQPCILAGGKKCLKTTLLIDLGISIASGEPFLGVFSVNGPRRFMLCSGESGLPTIQETSRRIAASKGLTLASVSKYGVCDELPRLDSHDDLSAWEFAVRAFEADVVAIDPAYLCMPGDSAENLFKTGALLAGVTAICRRLGVTLIIAHHTTKRRSGRRSLLAPPELEDIAWAGFQEFARQWLLLRRYQRFVPGTGSHRLWMNCGGSAGHSALHKVDVEEGRVSDRSGRRYEVMILNVEGPNVSESGRTGAECPDKTVRLTRDVNAIIAALKALPKNHGTMNDIRKSAGLNSDRFKPAIAAALKAGRVISVKVVKGNGQTYDAYELCHSDSPGQSI